MTKSEAESEQPIISNNFVKCYSDRLVIDLYYFPYGNKTVKYKNIQSCKLLKMHDLSIFKYKAWGMGLSPIWWPSDIRRFWRKYYIILDANQWPQIGITMDDKDIIDVYELIQQKINENQSTKPELEKKPFDSIGKFDPNTISSMSEKELDYQKLLENNRAKYVN
jgi:hypothetical protein